MRLLPVVMAALPVVASAQRKDAAAMDSLLNPPLHPKATEMLATSATVHDLGTIKAEDGERQAVFVLTNQTSQDITIQSIRTSCSCTKAKAGHMVLHGGDTTHVTLTYNPRGRLGEIDGTAIIYTQQTGSQPAARLALTGKVITDDPFPHLTKTLGRSIKVARKELAVTGLKNGQKRTAAIPCGNIGNRPVTLNAAMLPDYISLTTSPSPIMAGAEADILFAIDGTKAPAGETKVAAILTGADGKPSDCIINITIKK